MASSVLKKERADPFTPETNIVVVADDDDHDYIVTTAWNYVSRSAKVDGAVRNVEIRGRSVIGPRVHIQGDWERIRIGRYVTIGRQTIVHPPPLLFLPQRNINNNNKNHEGTASTASSDDKLKKQTYVPVRIGSHCIIGEQCTIHAASIGSVCHIGNHVTLGERCIVKDGCIVVDRTIVPADTVIPPFTRVSCIETNHDDAVVRERPRIVMQPLPPAMAVELQERAVEMYQEFDTAQRKR
jgi:dynactin-5